MWPYNKTDELYHYGVIGMKWGVRRAKNISPSKAKSGKQESSKSKEKTKEEVANKRKKYLKTGLIVVGSALAIYGAYKFSKSDTFKNLIQKGKDVADTPFDTETGFAKIKGTQVNLESINKINLFSPGTYNNCGNCSIASELRHRGLDVVAKKNRIGMTVSHIGQYFSLDKDAVHTVSWDQVSKTDPSRTFKIKKIFDNEITKSFPDGSRGTAFLPLDVGNHYVNWSLKKGSVTFDDAQDAKRDVVSLFDQLSSTSAASKSYGGARFIRLDNARINNETLGEVVKQRKGLPKSKIMTEKVKNLKFNIHELSGPGFVIKDYLR